MAVAYSPIRDEIPANLDCNRRSSLGLSNGCIERPRPSLVHSWYALRTTPRHEKLIATVLQHKGYEVFLPLYECRRDRRKLVQLPVFPGYLFCQFSPTVRLPILITPGVLQIVGLGRVPVPIDPDEIEAIRCLAFNNLQLEPWPYLEVGQKVQVRDGPLKGTIGVLLAVKNGHRLVLSLTLLRRAVAVEVDHRWVAPVLR
jgi:transcription antitermination factor NusG